MTVLVALAFLIPLTGCNLAPKYSMPAVATAPAFKEVAPAESIQSGNWKAAEPGDTIARGKWWEMFDDVELNRLEEQSTDSNQSIAAAMANFLAAGHREVGTIAVLRCVPMHFAPPLECCGYDFLPFFHGDNTGSNPFRDANRINDVAPAGSM
jgi:hypothetical protein